MRHGLEAKCFDYPAINNGESAAESQLAEAGMTVLLLIAP